MFKPLAVYASFAFIAIQVIDVVIKRLFFPDWLGTFVVVVILIGFPVTFFHKKLQGPISGASGIN